MNWYRIALGTLALPVIALVLLPPLLLYAVALLAGLTWQVVLQGWCEGRSVVARHAARERGG